MCASSEDTGCKFDGKQKCWPKGYSERATGLQREVMPQKQGKGRLNSNPRPQQLTEQKSTNQLSTRPNTAPHLGHHNGVGAGNARICAHGVLSAPRTRAPERRLVGGSGMNSTGLQLRWCCSAECPRCGGNKTNPCGKAMLLSGLPSRGVCCPFAGVEAKQEMKRLCKTKEETACASLHAPLFQRNHTIVQPH